MPGAYRKNQPDAPPTGQAGNLLRLRLLGKDCIEVSSILGNLSSVIDLVSVSACLRV